MSQRLLILGLCLVLLTACSPKNIKLGVALPLSGSSTARGQEILNAVMLAVEDVNKAGGVNGRKVELAIQDDRDAPAQGERAAQALLEQNVIGVIGHYSSDVTLAALPRYVAAETALISPSVTLSKVPHEGHYFFRTIGDNQVQTQAAFDFIEQGQYQRVVIVHNRSLFGQDLAQALSNHLKAYPAAEILQVEDTAELLPKILPQMPELIFYAGGYRDAALFLQRLREAGSQADFMGGNSLHDPEFVRLAGLVHIGKVWVTSDIAPVNTDFETRYRQRFGQPGLYSPYAYDATRILLNAAENARAKPAAVAEALRKLPPYVGLTGTLNLNPALAPASSQAYETLQINAQGQFELVEPQPPAFGNVGQIMGAWAQTLMMPATPAPKASQPPRQ